MLVGRWCDMLDGRVRYVGVDVCDMLDGRVAHVGVDVCDMLGEWVEHVGWMEWCMLWKKVVRVGARGCDMLRARWNMLVRGETCWRRGCGVLMGRVCEMLVGNMMCDIF